ncbi:type IV pilus twitching motility protein PilT [Coraliomargarita akajimensis]|uniref:Twitching motility protein n=1 Tax=Coraliomargarita akajimensis (strain DSM 45221 / IAM 15411 / JCM 23193 / KCTC 12865 / 04OKA010-24) TaxID=583355 RepID=D5EI07_CORAD|nr:PilT/PilU family type 4a pilus ATPase [Coraliomargarita akajimensis]ADE56047.1 twitching motility protein [Coraliomargarita akajimensis DSM 45221]
MSEYDTYAKVYSAQGGKFSIIDLLRSFADPELEVNGMSRISDLHMKVGDPVRYRYDGDLEVIQGGEVLTEETLCQLVFPLITDEQRESFLSNRHGDLDAGFYWEEQKINFRINLFRDRDGIACVMRMLPKSIPELDEMGFLDEELWQKLVGLKQGLVLVTGVTGSGKSTTIASIIDYINKSRKVRIITLEDPVEYTFSSEQALVSQRELGSHLDTFSQGLRSALRENPDIIYVGEIRDAETASLALNAAETGHMVLSTLHTKDVTGSFGRVIDMFPAEQSHEIAAQLSFSLAYVISQKLIPRKDGNGRVPAFEVMKNELGLGNLIRTGKLHQVYGKLETSGKQGMNTLEQHLIALVEADIITKEEAILHANDGNIVSRLD